MISLDTTVVQNGNGVNSFAFPALSTAEPNEILLAGFHFSSANQSAVTFSGSLNWYLLAASVTIPTAGGEIFLYWAKATQQTAGQAFTATFVDAVFPQCSGIITAYKGCRMAEPIGAVNSGTVGTGTTVSAAITTTRANSLCVGFAGQTANNAMAAGASQTEANETASVGGFSRCNSIYQDAITANSGSSVTMSSTVGINTSMAIYAIELIEAAPRPSFRPNVMRPYMFSPGNVR